MPAIPLRPPWLSCSLSRCCGKGKAWPRAADDDPTAVDPTRLPAVLGWAGGQLRTPAVRAATGSGSSERGRGLGLHLGEFSRIRGIIYWCSTPAQVVEAGAGCDQGLGCSPAWGSAARLCQGFHQIMWWAFFWCVFVLFWFWFFCTAFSLLRCCRGVLGITEREFTQPWRQRLCGGVVRRCPRGRRGREGPGDGITFLLLPPPGKDATSPCQHRPLGKRADVCVLLHVGVRASFSPCSEPG